MIKIAFVLYTQGLEYDDRIRKEALSLSKSASIEIFVLTPKNAEETGITSYGVPFRSFSLKTRDLLASGKFTFLKSLEFYFRVKKYLKSFDVIWVCDEEPFLIPLLYNNKKIVWDLHELPMRFNSNIIMKKILLYLEFRCAILIHANEYRKDYCIKNGLFRDNIKHFVIRNYPDNLFQFSSLLDEKYDKFREWLDGSDYAYIQGIWESRRFPKQTLEAILNVKELKAVVIGGVESIVLEELEEIYGKEIYKKLYFCGKIDQLFIPHYLRNASLSIVLYAMDSPNWRYCEPNRMFQSIILDTPVVVGCNRPMKDIVDKYGFGIAMKNEGSDLDEIVFSINELRNNHRMITNNISKNKDKILWSVQENTFIKIFTELC